MIALEQRPHAALHVVPEPPPRRAPSVARLQMLFAAWLCALVAALGLVAYGLGPFFEQRDQSRLLRTYKADVSRSANEATGLAGVSVPTKAPKVGVPVAILEVGKLKLQKVVEEGVRASQTRRGPGHVPGTAAPGQPGNSVLVGRRAAFGHAFGPLGKLHKGDAIVATTTQGQSLYRVSTVRHDSVHGAADRIYGPSKDDRLTLVTSGSSWPFAKSTALIVTARMVGTPFAPTPQGGRTGAETGNHGDSGAVPSVFIAVALYGLAMVASVAMYRLLLPRTAYLLTIAPVLALTIVAAETLARAFPAWM